MMNDHSPLVSILLPSKNPGRFLQERLRSIFAQSMTDWELIIVDSNSNDGSLEVFNDLVKKDSRVSLFIRPPGLYQAWNFAIEKARGKYVYFATADDTMSNTALEKMSNALEEHPECDLCDSLLRLIDGNGNEIHEFDDMYVAHYWHLSYPRNQIHVREKPADFFAHLGGKTVYTSITQLMIKRTLFDKTGYFPVDFGPSADYMWGMRASLYANVIFLPEYLSAWRIHDAQATHGTDDKTRKNFFLMAQMAQQVLKETPQDIRKEGEKIVDLVIFKGYLLPAKKFNFPLMQKLCLLYNAFLHTPLLTLEFLLTFLRYVWRIPPKFAPIYAYDKMIIHRTKRYYDGKIKYLQ